ncbi:O-antigen ligase family protein [Sulfurimonas sp. HSL3-7]|uniref:O-antigen ligase family protein n=1 Tax=Sulfonitrofixus jiaomeiensis TaxID=3131938 RepID=UPI0031F8C745
MWFIEADYKKLFNGIRQSKFLTFLTLFVSFQLISIFWTETSYAVSHSYFNNYLLWFAIPILSVSLKRKDLSKIVTVFLSAMFISEITAYGMYFELWRVRGYGPEYPSPFIHHGAYSIFMAFTALLLLNRIYSSLYSNREKIVMGIFFLTISGNLFISLGRIGQLAYALAILSAGIIHFKLRFKTILLSFLLVAALFTAAYQMSPMFQHRIEIAKNDINKIMDGNFSSSWGMRAAYIILGAEIIKDHPMIGVGIGDVRAVAHHYIDTDRVSFSNYVEKFLPKHQFHNQYLMVMVQSGLIGILLFLAMFYALFRLPIVNQETKQTSILFGIIFMVAFISNPFLLVNETRTLFILFTSVFAASSLQAGQTRQIQT